MNILKTSTDFFIKISEPFAPKSEQERKARARWAAILFIVLTIINILYWRQFF